MTEDSASRIAADLRDWVATAAPGTRVPSSRALVDRWGASAATVQRAIRLLATEGLVEARPGVGTFVRAVRTARPQDYGWQTTALRSPGVRLPEPSWSMRPTPEGAIGLHAGYPDRELLPERALRAALGRAARSDAVLSRAPVAGLPELRAWFAAELASATPAGVSPPTGGDVLVLPGSQSGLSSIFRALVGAGRPVLVESPTYWGAILAAAQAGVQVVPVASGPAGPDPDDLRRAITETGARAFYAQPVFANPTGAHWSAETRADVLDVVRAHGAFLIEDDWARDFGIDAEPVPVAAHDDAGHVVYVRSLTKSVSPAIRIAAVVARGPARERLLRDGGAASMYVSGLLQAAALDVVTQPAWTRHLRHLGPQLRARRDLLVSAVREHVPDAHLEHVPAGGLNLWLRLPDGVEPRAFARACEAAGVLVAPGTEWFPAEPAGPYVRLNYSGPDPGAFAEGARRIGAVLAGTG
ncbi:PLP-dependent aminotransferase family protein [Patulibacter americanus]|uniref:aminotransferase-like domain-containing protein n=1 Tax=Patulibacter americanus TaxID=588672 RepID=UPI0003B65151|nr:PLP-dependent aminotransferase family protein [Patulibacter americanus]